SDDVVRNSPGVRRKLAEGIGSLPGWRKGVCQKKIETHRKIVKDSRNAYRECVEWIRKLARSTLGDHQRKIVRLTAGDFEGLMGKPLAPKLGTHQECIESSPRVLGVYKGVAREFARRRSRLTGRLSGVAETLARRLDDAVGARREFAKRFAEGIGKLVRNMPGDHRRKTMRLTIGDSEGCWNTGVSKRRVNRCHSGFRAANGGCIARGRWVNRPYPEFRAVEPPRSVGEPRIAGFSRYV
ncbi:hypothetical protein GW17_00056442, partial [Ensete ventricosum]